MIKKSFTFAAVFLLVGTVFFTAFASAATMTSSFSGSTYSSGYSSYQTRASYDTYYTSEQINTYWPVLGDRESCEGRQDLILQVAPAGCQPAVVRSDLIAEQNVPVFCQVDAFKINPLVDIEQISNIRFTGNYPEEVVGVGFHPARAALRTYDKLLGSPLINNVGYVVVVLKQQPNEKLLPEFVNVTLSAQIEYLTGNAIGIGKTEFVLEQTTDAEWETEKLKQSFWKGRYFVKLEEATPNYAVVSIYYGDSRVATKQVKRGETSSEIFVPGMYCRAGLRITYDGFVSAKEKARIEVSSDSGTDAFDVYEGMSFFDGRCTVRDIKIDETGDTGEVDIVCGGKKSTLKLGAAGSAFSGELLLDDTTFKITKSGDDYFAETDAQKDYSVEAKKFKIDKDNRLYGSLKGKSDEILLVSSDGKVSALIKDEPTSEFLKTLRTNLVNYKNGKKDSTGLKDRDINETNAKKWFKDAIADYERVADDYSSERDAADEGAEIYGESALAGAIELAGAFGAAATKARLINKFLEKYPSSDLVSGFVRELNDAYRFDTSLAGDVIDVDGITRTVRLVSLSEPSEKASAELEVSGKRMDIKLNEIKDVREGDTLLGRIKLEEVDAEKVQIAAYCLDANNQPTVKRSYTLNIDGTSREMCGSFDVKLKDVDAKEVVKIRLEPVAYGTQTETNFSVHIGIEKRAIELTPDKALEKIENLNETIKKWEDISAKLGNVVKGLKAACFATAALLTFKNLLTGFSGETLARQDVMGGENGWREKCKEMVADGKYPTLDACYLANSGAIDSDVADRTAAINEVNQKILAIQQNHQTSSGIFGSSVDTDAVRKELAAEIAKDYGNVDVTMGQKKWLGVKDSVKVSELVSNPDVLTSDSLRAIYLNAKMGDNTKLREVAERVSDNVAADNALKGEDDFRKRGLPKPIIGKNPGSSDSVAEVRALSGELKGKIDSSSEATHVATINVQGSDVMDRSGQKVSGKTSFDTGNYVLLLKEVDARRRIYNIVGVAEEVKNGDSYSYEQKNTNDFTGTYKLGNIQDAEGVSYHHEIAASDRKVRYYETEPYKGMPAVVPFDVKNGWYAATKQTLPAFGGIGAFDSSGRVVSFMLCNVGENGKIQFDSGYGDDICQVVNLNTGQPTNVFPGLEESEARTLVTKAVRAVEDAARQYGSKFVTINGERFEVGAPTVGVAGTQCQDFMSPKECLLLFNVCDPVICPASRCNLGGAYPVTDVIQTGIVGSIFLCLPNIREGIIIPVCLTGIQAGIDSLISIMRNYRDCLQESLATGKMVGVCDEIYSIYLCEFLWREIAPIANLIIPAMVQMAYGQGARGGAEYLTVMAAWQNMQSSINYFTNFYAVNAMNAFKIRNTADVGTEVCKVFISAKWPETFEALIEPDSPPQFYAWFDSTTYSTATVPATAQYKVFYHIYGGKDQGVYFSVYLKSPPESSYYTTADRIMVDSGYIARGEYASQTRDFTAPEGYKELCVRINQDEHCGFKQVSTDFAINYLRDSYVNDESLNQNIMTESECISGSANALTLLNPNVQAGAEETLFPEVYNRGIIRICASENPGSKTDPTRFVDVGYCDDTKIRCWLDKRSVNNAITDSNIGMKNATLEELEKMTLEGLAEQGYYLDEDATAQVRIVESKLNDLRMKTSSSKISDAESLLTEIETLSEKIVMNHHKAKLLLIQARVKDLIAREYLKSWRAQAVVAAVSAAAGTATALKYVFTFDGAYTEERIIPLKLEGKDSKYSIQGHKLIYQSIAHEDEIGGFLPDGKITLNLNARDIIGDEFDKVDGAVITGVPAVKECETNSDCVTEKQCVDYSCENGKCAEKSNDETKCDDENDCTVEDKCLNGECVGKNADDGVSCDDGKGACKSGECILTEEKASDLCSEINFCSNYSVEDCASNPCGLGKTCVVEAGTCIEQVIENKKSISDVAEPATKKCEDCDGWFTSCDYDKCMSYGENCYFVGDERWKANCVDKETVRGTINSCSDYSLEECERNVLGFEGDCELGSSESMNVKDICVKKKSVSEEPAAEVKKYILENNRDLLYGGQPTGVYFNNGFVYGKIIGSEDYDKVGTAGAGKQISIIPVNELNSKRIRQEVIDVLLIINGKTKPQLEAGIEG